MRMQAFATIAVAALALGCGGPPSAATRAAPLSQEARVAADGHAEEARLELVAGDLTAAGRIASQALQLDPEEPVAREVAARVALAEGRNHDAIAVLAEARRPRLVRLRARAHARRGEWARVAADLDSVEEREPADGWAEAVLPVARAARRVNAYEISGDERATLPMDTRAPVPVVEIAIDGRTVSALVATSADLTVVDDDLRASPGVASEIALGGLTLRNVPVLSRDLGTISETLGIPIEAVIGTDLMLRLETTIDGRERWVVFRRAGQEPPGDAARVPFVTFEGTFLAVPVALNGQPEAWFTLDTSGLFPVALAPRTVEALGLRVEDLEPAPNAPSSDIRVTELATVRMGQMQMDGVPAVTGLVPADLSEAAGAPVGGMIGAAMVHQLVLILSPEARALFVH